MIRQDDENLIAKVELEERLRFEENKLQKTLEEEEKTIKEESQPEQSQEEEPIYTTAWNIWSNLVDNVKKTVNNTIESYDK